MSNFTMGTISGMGFAQAQVHTNHSTKFLLKKILSEKANGSAILKEIQSEFNLEK